ncbi:MAG: N-formylglutamate amidohydrolase [Lysobacterales bacterium]|nr:MAG: N-formylglutamate amidohydrolase [Xanthomonadales bacterium]
MSYLIPDVLERFDPEERIAPVVFDSPHSGNIYPDDFGHRIDRIHLRQTEDAFIDELFADAPGNGATLLCALFPRSYVDPNRSPDDIDPSMLDGEWPYAANPGEKTKLGIGLIPSREPGGVVYDRLLSVEEACHRLDTYYWPYHKELERALDRAQQRVGVFWHVNCHSMPAVSTTISPEGPGVPRADFCLGTRDGTTCNSEFVEFVESFLAGLGYSVTINDQYKGVELVRRYSDPVRDRHSLQVEINRGLYMDEATITKNHGFDALKNNIGRLMEATCDFARAHIGPRRF